MNYKNKVRLEKYYKTKKLLDFKMRMFYMQKNLEVFKIFKL